ncbi:MAG: hypothetical protein JWM03_714 [Rhodocyclales bacterium]|nr:hypothetical protein [Rhodocyclales bacterium]
MTIAMTKIAAEIIGIDHIYIAVTDLSRSEAFYDTLMTTLGFRKNSFVLNGDMHIQYFNRHFGYVLRPAKSATVREPSSDACAPGMHHLCLRVDTIGDLAACAAALREAGIAATEPKHHPEYAPDYWAIFFSDPDGTRLEITSYRQERRERHDKWDTP